MVFTISIFCPIAAWSPDRVGTVRLIGGPDSSTGRLEVFHNSFWGSVCNKDWTINESRVVCHELGFTNGTVLTADYRQLGMGGGPIALGSVSCTGEESLVNQCVNSTDITDCTHTNDVGIVCQSKYILLSSSSELL